MTQSEYAYKDGFAENDYELTDYATRAISHTCHTDNFNNVPVTFFIQGGYRAQDGVNAEFAFMMAVTQIRSKPDSKKCLVSSEVEKYWGTAAIVKRVTNMVIRMNDTRGENNIFDISDSLDGIQPANLTQEQRDAVKQRLESRIEVNVTTYGKLKSVTKLVARDEVKKAFAKLHQFAVTAEDAIDMQRRIYQVLIDRFKYDSTVAVDMRIRIGIFYGLSDSLIVTNRTFYITSTVFHKANLDKLLEADFIVKFWCPVIENLFLGTKVRPH
ncbi:hypothetical protein BJV82DRAFT_669870 [Fennellomyces sp. T-0311]|nr:hypothetical protein BJV82DRAFT_669870 [Fennellomyces sp. T-0311]